MNYVCGFLFRQDGDEVALIEKRTGPKHLHGYLNGIGGKIEPNERHLHAMQREFREETGALVFDWTRFATLEGTDDISPFCVRFYFSHAIGTPQIRTMTHETVGWYRTSELNRLRIHPQARWLIPMAMQGNVSALINYNS
jgi:8-oxo-dGTP pyrophosphatase MutT (NUDIX family)